jgi:hypothetical protein
LTVTVMLPAANGETAIIIRKSRDPLEGKKKYHYWHLSFKPGNGQAYLEFMIPALVGFTLPGTHSLVPRRYVAQSLLASNIREHDR